MLKLLLPSYAKEAGRIMSTNFLARAQCLTNFVGTTHFLIFGIIFFRHVILKNIEEDYDKSSTKCSMGLSFFLAFIMCILTRLT